MAVTSGSGSLAAAAAGRAPARLGRGARRRPRRGRRRGHERPAHGEQRRGREVLAGLTPAVILVVSAQPVQPQAAETVLVEVAAAFHLVHFGAAAPLSKRVAVGVGGAHPDSLEARSGGPDVVVHLPAGPQAVFLVGTADGLDDLASDGQAEVRQAVQRLERSCGHTEAPASQRGRPGHLRRPGTAEHALLVPRAVGRGTGQAPPRVVERRHQQPQAARAQHRAALNEDHHRRVSARSQLVETRGGPQRLGRTPLRETGQRRLVRDRRRQRRIRPVGQQHDLSAVDAIGPQRPYRLDQARRLGVRVHPNHDTRTHGPNAAPAGIPRRHQPVTAF